VYVRRRVVNMGKNCKGVWRTIGLKMSDIIRFETLIFSVTFQNA
jgi:hypothetical protein